MSDKLLFLLNIYIYFCVLYSQVHLEVPGNYIVLLYCVSVQLNSLKEEKTKDLSKRLPTSLTFLVPLLDCQTTKPSTNI